jgi:hypothetical protein
MANITGTAVDKVETIEAASAGNSDAESSMSRANRLIREHRKRVEEKASAASPAEA